MVEEDISLEDICQPRRPGHVLFPEKRNATSSLSLCQKMKAQMSVPTTRAHQAVMDQIYLDHFEEIESEGNEVCSNGCISFPLLCTYKKPATGLGTGTRLLKVSMQT